jgi:hypothetical protein
MGKPQARAIRMTKEVNRPRLRHNANGSPRNVLVLRLPLHEMGNSSFSC